MPINFLNLVIRSFKHFNHKSKEIIINWQKIGNLDVHRIICIDILITTNNDIEKWCNQFFIRITRILGELKSSHFHKHSDKKAGQSFIHDDTSLPENGVVKEWLKDTMDPPCSIP